jgi:uncharacterized protein
MNFWDTSALIALILGQNAAEEVDSIITLDNELTIWWGTELEASSAIVRLSRGKHISEVRKTHALQQTRAMLNEAVEIPPTVELRNEALRAVCIHALTAGDALQLAAALIWAEHNPRGLGFVCLDDRLREAAYREGFEVLPR